MRKNFIAIFLGILMLVIGCADDSSPVQDSDEPLVLGDPVETNAPNTSYEPAFEGQTRIGSVETTTAYSATILASSLVNPWDIANLPDGRLLVTERMGQMRIVTMAGEVSEPIIGIPAVNSSGQGGLLGVCIDPAFETNRMIYWTYVGTLGGGNAIVVAKGRLADNEGTIENSEVIYTSTTPSSGIYNYGSRIIFDYSGSLLVSFGDRSANNIRIEAQSVTSSIGKIIRITTNGDPAAGNPNIGSGALPEVYTMGHRNPQGIAIHPVTGAIWECEHGPRGGDELNLLTPGTNYGWPIISYGIEYSGQQVGEGIQQQEGMEQPVYYWDPVVSPSGITFYSGNRIPEWDNNLFLCSLTQTHLIRLVIQDNVVVGEERLLIEEGQRFRDVTQGLDEALYAITDEGRLYRIDAN